MKKEDDIGDVLIEWEAQQQKNVSYCIQSFNDKYFYEITPEYLLVPTKEDPRVY